MLDRSKRGFGCALGAQRDFQRVGSKAKGAPLLEAPLAVLRKEIDQSACATRSPSWEVL